MVKVIQQNPQLTEKFEHLVEYLKAVFFADKPTIRTD